MFDPAAREVASPANPEYAPTLPDVHANKPPENLSLVLAIPVGHEWTNGQLLRNVRAILSQHVDKGIEADYIVNLGENHMPHDPAQPIDPILSKKYHEEISPAVNFLKKVVKVQDLSRSIQEAQKQVSNMTVTPMTAELNRLLESEDDLLVKDALKLASERAGHIAISLTDFSHADIGQLGYRSDYMLGNYRTYGMDFAKLRLKDNSDGLVMMYDVDTIPSTNNYAQEIIRSFEDNQAQEYMLMELGYQPPGGSRDIVSDSPFTSASNASRYNLISFHFHPSQLCFRIRDYYSIRDIDAYFIEPGFRGFEDFDTATKIIAYYGDMQQGALFEQTGYPVSLTGDREGLADGMKRTARIGERGLRIVVDTIIGEGQEGTFTRFRNTLLSKIRDSGKQQEITDELERTRDIFRSKQKILSRFNRLIAHSFFESIDNGDIVLQNGSLEINDQRVLPRPGGKALLHYVKANGKMLSQLTVDDIKIARYYVGMENEFPANVQNLTPFQQAIKEYLGEYPEEDIDDIIRVAVAHKDNPDIRDKKVILQPVMSEIAALGYVYNKYFRREEVMADFKQKGGSLDLSSHMDNPDTRLTRLAAIVKY